MPSLHDLPAPAKLNLFLHVTGKRPDGYHLLQSVFVLIDWQDTLHIDTRSDGHIRRHDLNVALPQDDLCLRAAKALQAESRTTQGCDIRIHKAIPWGAGLGGGSSDAATVLLALNELWGLNWSRMRLAELAIRLGADVPFFVKGDNAWVEGIGERITPIDLPDDLLRTPIALLKPSLAVPTGAIFGSDTLCRDSPLACPTDFLAQPMHFGHNDLQPVAVSYPSPDGSANQIGLALALMRKRFGNSRMTGSGSTVFSWITKEASAPDARTLTKELGLNDGVQWTPYVCHILPTHPLNHLLTCN